MNTEIYHTENAGVYLTDGNTGILIDGIHGGRSVGYSEMEKETGMQIWNRTGVFRNLKGLLFTHLHIDHFEGNRVKAFMDAYPDIAIWGPGIPRRHVGNWTRSGTETSFLIGKFCIRAYDTEHSGDMFKEERHCSLLVSSMVNNESVFLSGDARFTPELAQHILCEVPRVDLIFIMGYQILEKTSIRFLEALQPGRVILYHNPDQQDDIYQQITWTKRLAEQNPIPGHTIEVAEHRKWIV